MLSILDFKLLTIRNAAGLSGQRGHWIALCVLILGCSDSPRSADLFLPRDSAGIRVWEHTGLPEADAEEWTLADAPSLVIGLEDGEDPYLFSSIRGVIPLSSGAVAVADGQSKEIRVFDRNGRHLQTGGGEGSGPGEFTRLRGAFSYRADSAAATENMGATISIFDSVGNWKRSATCKPASSSFTGLFVEGALFGGEFLVRGMKQFQTEPPTEGYHRESSVYQICGEDGEPGPILAEVPDLEFETLTREGRPLSFPLEMGRKAAAVVLGDAVLLGVTDRLELQRYGADGVLQGILRVGIPPSPLTDETIGQWIEHHLESVTDPETARQTRLRYRDRIWPDSLPVFSELRGDSEGNLWVRRFRPTFTEGPGSWWVFGPDGSFLARAILPADLRVEAIGTDFVLGVMADELGVQRVFRFPLVKTGRFG